MSWNWSYSKRKQKEMAEKSAAYQAENDTYKYTEFSTPPLWNTTKWSEERAKELRTKIIAIVMLSLISMVFITIIAYFITYGV